MRKQQSELFDHSSAQSDLFPQATNCPFPTSNQIGYLVRMSEPCGDGSRIKPGMTNRQAPRWTIAFLRALERSGEVRAAAKDAGIDFSTAYARRRAHAEFAERWAAALEAHKAGAEREREEAVRAFRSSREGPSTLETPFDGPPPHRRCRGDSEGPSTIETSFDGPPPHRRCRGDREECAIGDGQVRRVHAERWTKRAERLFFATLAETANVKMAVDAVGFSTSALYARRLRDALFAEKWAAAVDTARMRIDLGLIELAKNSLERLMADVPGKPPPLTVGEALQILKIGAQPHVPTEPDGRRWLNAGARANLGVATNEEIAEALAKRLAAFSKRIEREKAAEARRKGEAEGQAAILDLDAASSQRLPARIMSGSGLAKGERDGDSS